MTNILLIDEDGQVQTHLSEALSGEEYTVRSAATGREGLALLGQLEADVIILDMDLPSTNGLEVYEEIRKKDRRVPVIFIADETDAETAIEAMVRGAFEFLTKPIDLSELKNVLAQAIKVSRMSKVRVAIAAGADSSQTGEAFIGQSSKMLDVFKQIGRVSRQNVTVLLRGESGSGKELAARAIYHHSARSEECFMAVNCAALPENLLESELFGHEKGAFTGANRRRIGKFEQCDGGTIFLDEIGDMSPLVQGKVLRLLQQQEFERVGGNETIKTDVRIIAATNQPLEEMVEEETFREDLYFRLKEVSISLPPLRERREDLPVLIEYFLNRDVQEFDQQNLEGLSEKALELMLKYDWPGNVRELQNVIKQALLNCTGPVVIAEFLPDEVRGIDPHSFPGVVAEGEEEVAKESSDQQRADNPIDLISFIDQRLGSGTDNLYAECVEELERYLFQRVLQETDGNQSLAAKTLGITRGKVRDRIQAFGINLDTTITTDSQDSE
ncbi:MAG: sigma-54-dependent Fis family transcriptional regulator [Planctomycetaceae bacterium]|nr:sigma-54-dependent Fis family transcriptional regulator [Planctomycetaceae bacterium]